MLTLGCAGDDTTAPGTTTTTTAAITTSSTDTTSIVPPTTTPVAEGFDDRTAPSIASIDDYAALAKTGPAGNSVVKFVVPELLGETSVVWMDSNFYNLHDEWYWFLLLNGQSVPGSTTRPVDGLEFDSVDDIYAWATEQGRGDLPLGLRFVGAQAVDSRLYSPEFYELALNSQPRKFGVGSLLLFPANEPDADDRWVIELEYTDAVTPDDVARFFEQLSPSLPDEIAANLSWVVRSPEQEATAQDMETARLPYYDRVVRFSDLIPPGEVAVYNQGIAAGRLLVVDEDGAALSDSTNTDILIVDNVPDWLPPAAALISSGPQTPLAHVNLLAQNRGIPNASQAGILTDAGIRQAARVRAPAIVRASTAGGLEIELITEAEYRQWLSLGTKSPIAVPKVDSAALPYVYDLTELAGSVGNEAEIDVFRPIIGGKSAGFLTLLNAEQVTTPLDPLAITVRAYNEHLALLQDELDAMLSDGQFTASAQVRFLMLEGRDDYDERYTSDADADFADTYATENPPDDLYGNILAAGGFKQLFRDTPIAADTLGVITDTLTATYGDYAQTQGLRFRSSSSVEDIEGFSGAGLYDSNTGFLTPEAQEREKDQKKSVERTLKKTWASYWAFEAFEERRLENVDHESGAMGVLVHSRFDDPLELNNGVAVVTFLPESSLDSALIRINVQAGDVSVTNPESVGDLPEVIEVRIGDTAAPVIDRVSSSTLTNGGPILADAAIIELTEQLTAATELWRDRVNLSLPGAQQIETLTLDFEFKTMAPGWPAYADDRAPQPSRLVVKQARSLDPGLRGLSAAVLALPVPRDVLARASLVELVECIDNAGSSTSWHEIFTDPLLTPDMGFSETPLVVGHSHDVPADSVCERTTLLSSPQRYLEELLNR